MENLAWLIEKQAAEMARLKSENERLKKAVESLPKTLVTHKMEVRDMSRVVPVRAEAIKEFAERLRQRAYKSSDWSRGEHPLVIELEDVEDVLEEMVGDEE